MKLMASLLSILFVLGGCMPAKNRSNRLSNSTLPSLEINCSGAQATDCLGVAGFSAGDAANKTVRVVYMQGTCTERGTNVEILGASTGLTVDVAGTNVQYVSTFAYSNSETEIEAGTYALWVYIDTSANSALDSGEPVYCYDLTVSGEIGAIALTSDWRDATINDQTTLQ